MPEETDWARYKRLPPDERDRLGFQQWQWMERHGTREIEQLRNAEWKLGDALQYAQQKTVKLNAETIRLRGLLRDLIRTTVAHHQSPNDQHINAAYVRARDAAMAAIGEKMP
jgi:hypothetical protein